MQKTAILLVALLLVTAVWTLDAGAAADTQTLNGEYVWNQGPRGKLKATFTARGENRWDVAFRFAFQGRRHVYKGTAEGTLSGGVLEGRVFNETGNREFTFRGVFEGDTFSGTHAEVQDGKANRTGTLTLSR